MALMTRAMAKRLAANNASSGSAAVATDKGRTILIENDTTVNADEERDDNGSCVSANGRDTGSSETPMPNIHKESESIHTRPPHPTVPKVGTTGRGRGTKSTRVTKPRRVRQATRRKGGSNRGTSAADVSGNMIAEIPLDHVLSGTGPRSAKVNNGIPEGTSIVAAGRKRKREETSDADSQTDRDIVSPRTTPRRRIRRNTRQSTFVDETPSVARNLRDSTNSSPEAKTKVGLDLPETRYGILHGSDEAPLNNVPGIDPGCSSYFQGEKENAPAEGLVSSPLPRPIRKGTCSAGEFVGARTILALSRERVFSIPEHNLEPRKESNGAHSQTETSHASPFGLSLSNERVSAPPLPGDHAEAVEAEATPTWEARELDPDDFAFLLRRSMPYRFEESNVRNEAFTRPAQEE
ncbi:hypothetical protein ACEPAI_1860 [Sanghuangporus weigelae]